METPSMCPVVCVGSLVADRPLVGGLHAGELITFHVPNDSAVTYTHEISRIFANGAIQTRGIADAGHDPWLITRSDIVGEVSFTVWELGWLLKALPFLAVGVLFWVVARPWFAERARRSWDRGWMTVIVVLPLWLLHPLVRSTVVSASVGGAHHPHLASDTVVNTGVLPVSFQAVGGPPVYVSSTHLGHVDGTLTAMGNLRLHEAVALHWWGLAAVVLAVLSPLFGCLWHVLRGDEAVPAGGVEQSPVAPPIPVPTRRAPSARPA